jgi:hypothetical protein
MNYKIKFKIYNNNHNNQIKIIKVIKIIKITRIIENIKIFLILNNFSSKFLILIYKLRFLFIF